MVARQMLADLAAAAEARGSQDRSSESEAIGREGACAVRGLS